MKRKRLASFGSALLLSMSSLLISNHPEQAFLLLAVLAGVLTLIAHRYNKVLAKQYYRIK